MRKSRRKSIPKPFFDDTPKTKKQVPRHSQNKGNQLKGDTNSKTKRNKKDDKTAGQKCIANQK